MVYIGIDPGKHTGIAVWNTGTKTLEVHTFTFWQAIKFLETKKIEYEVLNIKWKAILEDPNKNQPIFEKVGVANAAAKLRIAQNVGSNKRDAQLLHEFLELYEIDTTLVKPITSKWKREDFLKFTKYSGPASQHAIDAAKLVYGF